MLNDEFLAGNIVYISTEHTTARTDEIFAVTSILGRIY